jgi:flagellar biosynthetic protein FliP
LIDAVDALFSQHSLSSPVDLLGALFIVAILPLLAISMTSFTRIIVVLGLLRASFGTGALPPTPVLVALALMLSAAIMAPTFSVINQEAIAPYQARRIPISQAIKRAERPLATFMTRQTRPTEIRTFARIARVRLVAPGEVPFVVLVPAFVTSELRVAFAMGFALALPFAVIDLIVAVILMSLGMFMVSPSAISLPIKLLLFVAADGWTLVTSALAASFR